MRWYVVANSRD